MEVDFVVYFQRYQLFKDGVINFSDLVNQNGKTLTVKQLKEKYS